MPNAYINELIDRIFRDDGLNPEHSLTLAMEAVSIIQNQEFDAEADAKAIDALEQRVADLDAVAADYKKRTEDMAVSKGRLEANLAERDRMLEWDGAVHTMVTQSNREASKRINALLAETYDADVRVKLNEIRNLLVMPPIVDDNVEKFEKRAVQEAMPDAIRYLMAKWRTVRASEHKPTLLFVRRWLEQQLAEKERDLGT